MTLRDPIFALLLALWATASPALEVLFQPVAENIHAFIGDTGGRTVENEGLNANLGLVVTPAGAVLIDSGATFRSAHRIDQAVKRITAQPVRWVVNTGGQDHRWLGNGYLRAQGVQIIAHTQAVADMRAKGGDQLAALPAVLQAGDMMVWLPQKNVLFTGGIVYVDRLLGVIPVSNTHRWLATFAVIEELAPGRIVPGHGQVTDLATSRARTRDYLQALRTHMDRAVEKDIDISEAVKTFDGRPYRHLLNATDLMQGNASRTYPEVERE